MKQGPEQASVTAHSALWRGRKVEWTVYDTDTPHNETRLILPGILAKQTVYAPLARAMQANGHRAATMAHESGSFMCAHEVRDVASELADRYQKPVRLVGHSLGAIHAVEAAEQDPSDMSGISLLNPAGFGGVHPTRAYQSIELGTWLTADRYKTGVKIGLDSLAYVIKGRKELATTIMKASTKRVIEEARGLPDTMLNHAILSPADLLIWQHEARRGLAEAGIKLVYVLENPLAGHNAPHDQAQEVADAIDELLDVA